MLHQSALGMRGCLEISCDEHSFSLYVKACFMAVINVNRSGRDGLHKIESVSVCVGVCAWVRESVVNVLCDLVTFCGL